MFKLFLINLFVAVQLLVYPALGYSGLVNEIAVVVNDKVITQSEVNKILMPIYTQYKSAYSGEELLQKLQEARKNVLNQMIEDKLMLQEAKKQGIEVSDEELEEKLNQVKSQFSNDEEFRQILKSENLTMLDLKEKYKEQIMIKKLINREVRSEIDITPTGVFRYYQEHEEDFRIPAKIKVQTILIRKTNETQSQSVNLKERIEKIYKELKEGTEFSKLAKEYSEDPSAEDGGNMGYIKKGEMMAKIDKALFLLKVGEISDIIETKIGYHIFKVNDKKESIIKPFKEARTEIENLLFQKKAKARFKEWMEGLKENAYISIK